MNWRTIKIFVSSTFCDMHAERDIIRKRVIPRLNESLAKLHISVITTDLRWGINTDGLDEATREAKVLKVCMEAISNSKPYFVALIGHRYGWIPSCSQIDRFRNSIPNCDSEIIPYGAARGSVTEMEILLGAIGSPERLNHSYFCFRNPDSYNLMDKDTIKIFVDARSDDSQVRKNAIKLKFLKQRIKETCSTEPNRLISYSGIWDSQVKRFTNLDKFANQLYERLYSDILNEYQNTIQREEVNIEEDSLQAYINNNAANFCGRTELLENLMDYATGHFNVSSVLQNKLGIILVGNSGCGKSYIFSALCAKLRLISKDKHIVVLSHAAGLTPSSISVTNMIQRWCAQLANSLKISIDERRADKLLLAQLSLQLQVYGEYPIFIIDSINSFIEPENVFKNIPFNVPLICTSTPDCLNNMKLDSRYRTMEVEHFGKQDAINLIEKVLGGNEKEISENLTETILSLGEDNPAYYSPLWTKLALSIITEIGEADFQKIYQINNDSGSSSITFYLGQIVREFPTEAEHLFRHFINFSANFFDRDLIVDSLCYIATSVFGIEERYLVNLIGDSWNQLEFESLRIWLRDFLTKSLDGKRWILHHNILRNVLIQDSKKDYRKLWLDMLSTEIKNEQSLLDEFIYQVFNLHAFTYLSDYLEKADIEDTNIAQSVIKVTGLLGIDSILQYLKLYIEKNRELDFGWIEMFIYFATELFDNHIIKRILEAYFHSVSSFTREEIMNANPELLGRIFSRYSFYIQRVEELGKDIYISEPNLTLENLRVDAIELFLELIQTRDCTCLSKRLCYDVVFGIWRDYIRSIREFCADTPALEIEEERYLNVLEWVENYLKTIKPIDDFSSKRCHNRLTSFDFVNNTCVYRINDTNWISKKTIFLGKNSNQRKKNELISEIEDLLRLIPNLVTEALEKTKSSPILDKLFLYLLATVNTYLCLDINEGTFLNQRLTEMLPKILKRKFWDVGIDAYLDFYVSFATRFGHINEIVALEGLLNSSWHDFFLTPDSEDYYYIMLRLQNEYESRGQVNKILDMYEKAFDLACYHYVDNSYDSTYLRFKPLCDIRPYYLKLIQAYSTAGEKACAIKCIATWLDLCDFAYTGQQDVNPCAEYYDEAYRYLACLYDGTVTLAEAICTFGKRFINDKILPVCLNNLWGYMDLSGKIVIPCQFLWASRAGGKYLSVYNGKKMAYIDYSGNPVTDFIFDDIMTMRGDEGWVKKNGRYSLFISGEMKPTDCYFNFAGAFYNGNLKVEMGSAHNTNLIRPDGKTFVLGKSVRELYTTEADDVILTRWHDSKCIDEGSRLRATLWDSNGQQIIEADKICPFGNRELTPIYNYNLGLGGYINRRGYPTIKLKYLNMRPFSEDIAAVASEHPQYDHHEIWGFVDSQGREIVFPQYDAVGDFHCGLAWVCKTLPDRDFYVRRNIDSKFGFINDKGELVIPMIYDDVSSFRDGIAHAWLNGEMIQINTSGQQI